MKKPYVNGLPYLKSCEYKDNIVIYTKMPEINLFQVKLIQPGAFDLADVKDAKSLVKYFHNRLKHNGYSFGISDEAETAYAKTLIRRYGQEKAKYIVDYSIMRIKGLGIDARAFGIVRTFEKEALLETRKAHKAESKRRRLEEAEKGQLDEIEREENEYRELIKKYSELPADEQERIRKQAEKAILSRGINRFITPLLIKLEITKYMKSRAGS